VLGYAISSALPPEAVSAWGWRIPLLFGCVIIPFVFVIRRTLEETEAFARRKHHPTPREIYRSILAHWRVILNGVSMVLMTTVSFYTITAYTPTYGRSVLHLSDSDALLVTLCVGLSNFLWLPVMGALSDRIGRRPLLLLFSGLALVSAYPVMSWLVGGATFGRLLLVELWLSFLFAGYNGAMVVHLTEIVPSAVRTAGFSLAYSLATTIGGATPALATWLIHATGNRAMPGAWLSVAAAIALAGILVGRRPAGNAAASDL
jgi:predicted MFS family arabinose efflux permease